MQHTAYTEVEAIQIYHRLLFVVTSTPLSAHGVFLYSTAYFFQTIAILELIF